MLPPCQRKMLARDTEDKEHAMSLARTRSTSSARIDAEPWCCGKSGRVAKWKPGSPTCRRGLIGMEACVGAHHLSRKLQALATMPG